MITSIVLKLAGTPLLVNAAFEELENWQPKGPITRVEPLWTPEALEAHTYSLVSEVVELRTELAQLHKQCIGSGCSNSDGAFSRSFPGRQHRRTLFVTMCAGTAFFQIYCGPFFASFERAYGLSAFQHRVVAFTSGVDPQLLKAAAARFAPWGEFEILAPGDLEGGEQYYTSTTETLTDALQCEWDEQKNKAQRCITTRDAANARESKTWLDSISFPRVVSAYIGKHGDGFSNLALMDSDTLFVRPIGPHLPQCDHNIQPCSTSEDWDIAFTVYDPDFTVPWADSPERVGRTQHGFRRINCGVVLLSLRNVSLTQQFLFKWATTSYLLTTAGEGTHGDEKVMWQHWASQLLDEFRGNDQAGLALLVASYDLNRLFALLGWKSCEACEKPVTAQLDLHADEQPLSIRFRALPARILNHPESMADGSFPVDLAVVHLKGQWWRTTLSKGMMTWDGTRRPTWNRDTLALHYLLLETWQRALPSELQLAPTLTSSNHQAF